MRLKITHRNRALARDLEKLRTQKCGSQILRSTNPSPKTSCESRIPKSGLRVALKILLSRKPARVGRAKIRLFDFLARVPRSIYARKTAAPKMASREMGWSGWGLCET